MEITNVNKEFDTQKAFDLLLKNSLDYELVGVVANDDNLGVELITETEDDIDNGLDLENEQYFFHYKTFVAESKVSDYISEREELEKRNKGLGVKLINTEEGTYDIYPLNDNNNFNSFTNFLKLLYTYHHHHNTVDEQLLINDKTKEVKSLYIMTTPSDNYQRMIALEVQQYFQMKLDDYLEFKNHYHVDNETQDIFVKNANDVENLGKTSSNESTVVKDMILINDMLDLFPDLEVKENDQPLFDIGLEKPTSKPNTSRIVRQMAEVGNPEYLFIDTKYDENWLRQDTLQPQYHGVDKRNNIRVCTDVKNHESDSIRILGHYEDVKAFTRTKAFHDMYNKERYITTNLTHFKNGMVDLSIYMNNVTFNNLADVTFKTRVASDIKRKNIVKNPNYYELNNDDNYRVKANVNYGQIVFEDKIVDMNEIKSPFLLYTGVYGISDISYSYGEYDLSLSLDHVSRTKNPKAMLEHDAFRVMLENI